MFFGAWYYYPGCKIININTPSLLKNDKLPLSMGRLDQSKVAHVSGRPTTKARSLWSVILILYSIALSYWYSKRSSMTSLQLKVPLNVGEALASTLSQPWGINLERRFPHFNSNEVPSTKYVRNVFRLLVCGRRIIRSVGQRTFVTPCINDVVGVSRVSSCPRFPILLWNLNQFTSKLLDVKWYSSAVLTLKALR